MYSEDEWLALSGIQHYGFCPRQWALIHIEQQWSENVLTIQGDLAHKRAHNKTIREKRGDTLTVRGLEVHSYTLGLVGQCDVVEFQKDNDGIALCGEEGLWRVAPVEYKNGRSKRIEADRMQLCAQAICLEEMLCCQISGAYLYYHKTRSRELVELSPELRNSTQNAADEMHKLFKRMCIPSIKKKSACQSCSIKNECLPSMSQRETVKEYVTRRMADI